MSDTPYDWYKSMTVIGYEYNKIPPLGAPLMPTEDKRPVGANMNRSPTHQELLEALADVQQFKMDNQFLRKRLEPTHGSVSDVYCHCGRFDRYNAEECPWCPDRLRNMRIFDEMRSLALSEQLSPQHSALSPKEDWAKVYAKMDRKWA